MQATTIGVANRAPPGVEQSAAHIHSHIGPNVRGTAGTSQRIEHDLGDILRGRIPRGRCTARCAGFGAGRAGQRCTRARRRARGRAYGQQLGGFPGACASRAGPLQRSTSGRAYPYVVARTLQRGLSQLARVSAKRTFGRVEPHHAVGARPDHGRALGAARRRRSARETAVETARDLA